MIPKIFYLVEKPVELLDLVAGRRCLAEHGLGGRHILVDSVELVCPPCQAHQVVVHLEPHAGVIVQGHEQEPQNLDTR